MLYNRINRSEYAKLDVNYLEFPPAENFLNSFCAELLIPTNKKGLPFRVQLSGELLKKIRDSYLYEDFSVNNLERTLCFAILEFCRNSTFSLKELKWVSYFSPYLNSF